jgi:hypothetical protein
MTTVTALLLSLSLVGAIELQAQRSGFIIGLGLGAGVTSYSFSDFGSGNETNAGLATDFKIGAQVSPAVQVYYLGRTNWFTPRGSNLVAVGISALGLTYVLPSAPVHVSAGFGYASWIEFDIEHGGALGGPGVTGGVGWEFADLWLLDFALTYGKLDDVDMFLARVGISILSH